MLLHPKVEDVPVPDRFQCPVCKRILDRQRIDKLEVLLGGWAKGVCGECKAHTTFSPKRSHDTSQCQDG